MSLIEALARRSAAASYAKFCRIEKENLDQVRAELDELWTKMRPAAFAAADAAKVKYSLEYACSLDCASDLTDNDIENALPEELINIRGGRLVVLRKLSWGNCFLINLYFNREHEQALDELKKKHAGKRQREEVKDEKDADKVAVKKERKKEKAQEQ